MQIQHNLDASVETDDIKNRSDQKIKFTGIVGEQPHLKTSETFCYTGAAIIEAPAGYMQGDYCLISDVGIESISSFSFSILHALH